MDRGEETLGMDFKQPPVEKMSLRWRLLITPCISRCRSSGWPLSQAWSRAGCGGARAGQPLGTLLQDHFVLLASTLGLKEVRREKLCWCDRWEWGAGICMASPLGRVG